MSNLPNTRISYCYRDAANWKFWGHFAVEGKIDRSDLEHYLDGAEFFVPEKVGLNHLLTEPWSRDDHILHELHEFEPAAGGQTLCTAAELIRRFRVANEQDWFSD